MFNALKCRVNTWLVYKIGCAVKSFFSSLFVEFAAKVRTIVDEHYQDKTLGIETSAFTSFENKRATFSNGVYKDGQIYGPITYQKLRKMVELVPMGPGDVFVDLGAGKGRSVFFMAQFRLKRIVAVELNKDLVDVAAFNCSRQKKGVTPVDLVHADAVTVDLSEATVIFLYNPFGPLTLGKVLENIRQTLVTHPRHLRIVYFNSVYGDVLDTQDWLERVTTLGRPADVVWRNRTNV